MEFKISFAFPVIFLFQYQLTTSHQCEKVLSSLSIIKTKYRSRIDAEPHLRLKLTSMYPDIAGLCLQRQARPSHEAYGSSVISGLANFQYYLYLALHFQTGCWYTVVILNVLTCVRVCLCVCSSATTLYS